MTWSPGSPGPALNSQLGMQDAVEMTKARSLHFNFIYLFYFQNLFGIIILRSKRLFKTGKSFDVSQL